MTKGEHQIRKQPHGHEFDIFKLFGFTLILLSGQIVINEDNKTSPNI